MAKNAIAIRTAISPNPGKPDHHQHHHDRWMSREGSREFAHEFRICAAPGFDPNASKYEYRFGCGTAFKAPINQESGQPIG
jgi:hypothetical protein